MTLDFTGQVVLVTGAGSGIGAAVARGVAARGATVAVYHHRHREGVLEVADAITADRRQAETVAADLSDPRAAAALVDEVTERWAARRARQQRR